MESITGAPSESVTSVCRSGEISETVVTAVAQATGVDPLDLDPLYDVVDPDALNTIFDSTGTSQPSSTKLSFTMADCRVVVHGDGEVVVKPQADADENPVFLGTREE